MPPLPRFKVEAVARLARELRFVPRERLLDDIRRGEDLALEIDPATLYPQDWLIFRITGYRPALDNPAMIVGHALRRDLVALVEHLCHAARLHTDDHAPGDLLWPDEVAARLGIGRKTLDRRRRAGLPSRRVIGADNHTRVAFRASLVDSFRNAQPAPPARARRFKAKEQSRMLRRADRYARLGLSLNAAALRIARRFGRSHEGVRQLLRREEVRLLQRGVATRFHEPAPLSPRRRAVLLRAARFGISAASIASVAGLTHATLRRALVLARAEQLADFLRRGWLNVPEIPGLDQASAEEKLLSLAPAHAGLIWHGPTTLVQLLEEARRQVVSHPKVEATRLWAMQRLRLRALNSIALLNMHHPSAAVVDRVETDLRWIARLKASLIAPELRVILGAIEARIGRSMTSIPPASLGSLFLHGLRKAAGSLDMMDPSRAGRVAAVISLSVDRVATEWIRAARRDSAARAAHIIPNDYPVRDWTRAVAPWQPMLEPDARLHLVLATMDSSTRAFLEQRFALNASAPTTLAELGLARGLDAIRVARIEKDALDAAWRAIRTNSPGRP